MKGWTRRAWFATKLLAFVAVVAVGAVLPAKDGREASASHTDLFFSLSGSPGATPATSSSLLFYPNGAPKTLYVWARNVTHDATGVSAFEIRFTYKTAVASVSSLQASTTWLQSTGRSATCTAPIIEPNPEGPSDTWRADIGCYTLGEMPLGPQGAGLLGSFVLTPGSQPSTTNLTMSVPPEDSFILNTTANATEITVTKRNAGVVVAKCGDVNADGIVSVSDIGLIVQHYGSNPSMPNWDPVYDLDANAVISVSDIGLVVLQFGGHCTAT